MFGLLRGEGGQHMTSCKQAFALGHRNPIEEMVCDAVKAYSVEPAMLLLDVFVACGIR